MGLMLSICRGPGACIHNLACEQSNCDSVLIKCCRLHSYSTWTPICWLWWRRAQTCIRSEASSGSFWSMAWPVVSSTRPFRERPEARCMLCILKTGWWWVLSVVFCSMVTVRTVLWARHGCRTVTKDRTSCGMWKRNTGDDHVTWLLDVPAASVWLCSMNTGAPSPAGTSSLSSNCTRGWSCTTALCSARWIDHMPLRCFSSLTFSHPPFLPWRPRWPRRASPAAICSVSFRRLQCYRLHKTTHSYSLTRSLFFFFFT